MSIEKHSLYIPKQNEQTNIKSNEKLNHLYHSITKLFEVLKDNAPIQCKNLSKYDLVCRNFEEGLLLLSYREKEAQRINNHYKKLLKGFK